LTSVLGLPDADYDVMDCVAANVAVLLALRGERDVRWALGSQWHFAFDADAGELLLDRLSLGRQLRLLAGTELRRHPIAGPAIPALAALVAANGAVLVYGDAFELPWLPLHRKVHLQHTFVVTALDERVGTAQVLDAYTNRTEHGDACPTSVSADLAAIVAAIEDEDAMTLHPGEAVASTAREIVEQNCLALLDEIAQRDPIGAFVAHHEHGDDRSSRASELALDCWLVARKRALHGRWLAVAAGDDLAVPATFQHAFAERIVTPWQRAATFAHIAERRVREGRGAPDGALRLIERELRDAERTLAERLLTHVRRGG
jgi:hypothetical protein